MSSPSSNANANANAGVADVGILAQNQSDSDDASSVSEGPKFTRRWDVYKNILQYGTEYCGNCCYADIADGSTTSPALPSTVGLRISGVGNVPLPISDDHGNEIKKRAPSEEEDNNGVYEIEASKIKIQNPQWDNSFKQLLTTVAYKLGVNPSKLTAELDGLTYMEKGGYIERSNDDDDDGNDNGVLGAIIIQLPSKFTGGALTIYNCEEDEEEDEDEDDEEEEKSFKFTLGAGEEAAYSCHFACHFLDCEYEMAKLWSGSRVLLRYSLHYKHDRADEIPTAGLIQYLTSPIESSLNGLPPDDRMVLIPLEREYDGLSLVNAGIKALSRGHRQKAEALKAARPDWEFLLVNAKLVHTCGYYTNYDPCTNETSVKDIFDEMGNCITSEMSWLKKSVDFDCVANDGMMLATLTHNQDECVLNWGPASRKCVHNYGSDQSFYTATFLVSYDPAVETELKCLGGCEEVAEVSETVVDTQDYDLLDRVLAVVESKEKSKFDVKSCQILLQMLLNSRKNAQSLVPLVNKIVRGLSSPDEPNKQLYDTIVGAVDKLGHAELSDSIQQLFADVKRKKYKDMCVFLRRMDFALKVNKYIEEGGPNYLEVAITDLNEYGKRLEVLDSAAVVRSIKDLISNYKRQRHELSRVVQASLTFLHEVRACSEGSLTLLLNRTHLLKHLLDQRRFGSLQTPLKEFVGDFLVVLWKGIDTNTGCKALDSKLKGDGKDSFVQAVSFVIDHGLSHEKERFGLWSIKKKSIFTALIEAIKSDDVGGKRLLRDILNKCLIPNFITYRNSDWVKGEKFNPRNSTLHIQQVLEVCPSIARMIDEDKRLPLHHAAAPWVQSYNNSFEVVMRVFTAYKPAASIRDPITKLYPFQLAASRRNYKASFSLLLENPSLVSSAINRNKSRGRKRKRMQKSSA
mmetsp:Transcript_1641/g.2638  ORF Transcript_1641/g.2638 Transcript_1641/m.2638 type:complete len:913 (-) Transcript_1641:79-2817(-)